MYAYLRRLDSRPYTGDLSAKIEDLAEVASPVHLLTIGVRK
jgi:hypothetical protein